MENIVILACIVMALSVGAHVIMKSKSCLHGKQFTIENDTIKRA